MSISRNMVKTACDTPEVHGLDAALDKVRIVLSKSADYRTVGGIARESGLTHDTVKVIITRHPEMFELAPLRIGGEPVYALRGIEECVPR